MKRKPIIAMLCAIENSDGLLQSRLQKTYVDSIFGAGGVPIILPFTENDAKTEEYAELCDGFLFTGGNDINPLRYGEVKADFCGEIEDLRDGFELEMARLAIQKEKPILGICRGAQLLNVALGGTLYQDINSEIPSGISHVQKEPKEAPSHTVRVVEGTPLFSLTEKEIIVANSFHHQAIKKLGRGLLPMAYAEDGIIEAVYSTEQRYLRAYQWHPERLFGSDEQNRKIFFDFVSACAHSF